MLETELQHRKQTDGYGVLVPNSLTNKRTNKERRSEGGGAESRRKRKIQTQQKRIKTARF